MHNECYIIIHNDVPYWVLWQYIFFQEIFFINIAKLYICVVLVNINNIYLDYSRCGPIHFNPLQDYSIGMFLRQTWNDSRLIYTPIPRLRSLELDSRLMDKIWVPDLFIANEKDAHFHSVTVPNKLMHIYPEGRIQYSVR